MERNEVKTFLRQYKIAGDRLRTLALEEEEIRAYAESITPALTGMPGGSGGNENRIPIAVENLEDVTKRKIYFLKVQAAVRSAILEADSAEADVLYRHYVRGQTWDRIAREAYLGRSTVFRLADRGLDQIAEKMGRNGTFYAL